MVMLAINDKDETPMVGLVILKSYSGSVGLFLHYEVVKVHILLTSVVIVTL